LRLLAPLENGMTELQPRVYVEPGMTHAQRSQLILQIAEGRRQVEAFFGSVESMPDIVACSTAECAVRFGSGGARAAALGDYAIRLSPDGLTAALVAHEWAHAEVYRRVGGAWAIPRIPRWFDEGIAVVIANEPRHSAENWARIQARGLTTPALSELTTYRDWIRAVQHYGETRGDHADNLRVVYSTAGNELRRWLSCTGKHGVIDLLAAVRDGTDFEAVYRRLESDCKKPVANEANGTAH
jgi:hypothetical protein